MNFNCLELKKIYMLGGGILFLLLLMVFLTVLVLINSKFIKYINEN